MRTVSFVERLEFECPGNVMSKALTVGDVDNDKGYELVIGNINGDLFIHKGTSTRHWRRASDLGMITCLEVGDICNHGINYLFVSSLEGWCYVFAVKPDSLSLDPGAELPEECRIIKPAFRQHLEANSKGLLIADIDGDGHNELVIGYSDRRVRSYRWLDAGGDAASGTIDGEFICLETWHLAGQMGSLTVNKCQNGSVDLMVSQPGGTFVTLLDRHVTARHRAESGGEGGGANGSEGDVDDVAPTGTTTTTTSTTSNPGFVHAACTTHQPPASVEELEIVATQSKYTVPFYEKPFDGPSLVYHPLGNARARNPGVTTEVVGNISRRKKDEEKYVPSYCAICTLDGTLTLVDEDKILWSLYVDHQLFTLTKVDITGDGTEEVVACSWDGRTYLVNLSRDVVRFNFNEHVAAFCAGYYALPKEGNLPCLIYVTFNNRVVVYYNINMPQIGVTNLLETMEAETGTEDMLAYYNLDPANHDDVRQLYHWLLYGRRSSNT